MLSLQEKERLKSARQVSVNNALVDACQAGVFSDVVYLLECEELECKAQIEYNSFMALQLACYYGHFDIIEYLFAKFNAARVNNIDFFISEGFANACLKSELIEVKKFIAHPVFSKYIDFHFSGDMAFTECCKLGRAAAVAVLFSEQRFFNNQTDLLYYKRLALKLACGYERQELVDYLINEQEVEYCSEMEKFFKQNPSYNHFEQQMLAAQSIRLQRQSLLELVPAKDTFAGELNLRKKDVGPFKL